MTGFLAAASDSCCCFLVFWPAMRSSKLRNSFEMALRRLALGVCAAALLAPVALSTETTPDLPSAQTMSNSPSVTALLSSTECRRRQRVAPVLLLRQCLEHLAPLGLVMAILLGLARLGLRAQRCTFMARSQTPHKSASPSSTFTKARFAAVRQRARRPHPRHSWPLRRSVGQSKVALDSPPNHPTTNIPVNPTRYICRVFNPARCLPSQQNRVTNSSG